jgi:uncharacterized protein YbaA (DUF1428 family)
MSYVDGFLIAVPRRKMAIYRRIARAAGRVWKEYGALDYVETVGDDLAIKMGRSFTKAADVKPGETVVFSWILYKSRAHRDKVNAAVMKDPRIAKMMKGENAMPFDAKRMSYGGFRVIVDL